MQRMMRCPGAAIFSARWLEKQNTKEGFFNNSSCWVKILNKYTFIKTKRNTRATHAVHTVAKKQSPPYRSKETESTENWFYLRFPSMMISKVTWLNLIKSDVYVSIQQIKSSPRRHSLFCIIRKSSSKNIS